MITLFYSGYYDMDNDKYPFEVNSDFFYLTKCDIPNLLLLKKHKKYYVHMQLPDIKWYDSDYFEKMLDKCFNADIVELKDIIQMIQPHDIVHTLPNIETHPQWSKLRKLTMDLTTISSTLSEKRTHMETHQQVQGNRQKKSQHIRTHMKHILHVQLYL